MAMQISPTLRYIDIAKHPADTEFYSAEVRCAQVYGARRLLVWTRGDGAEA